MERIAGAAPSPRSQASGQRSPAATEGASGAGSMARDSYNPAAGAPRREAGETRQLAQKMGSVLADNLLYRETSATVLDFEPVRQAGLALELKAHPLAPNDGLLTSDPNRARAIAAMRERGQEATWAEVRGMVRPRASLNGALPVGPASLHGGAWAEGEIGLSVLSAYPHSFGAPVKAARDLTLDFPFDAAKARGLMEGSEAVMRGRGSLGVSAGATVGHAGVPLGAGFQAGVSTGVSTARYVATDLSLRIKRLEGQRVFVSLSEIDSKGSSYSVGAQAGIQTPIEERLTGNQATSAAGKLLDHQLERWLRVEAHAIYATSESEREVSSYVLDLASPEAAKAYERLLRLDRSAAEKLAAQPGAPVRAARLTERSKSRQESVEANLASLTLYSGSTTTSKAAGHLESSRSSFDYHLGTVEQKHEDIVTRWWGGRKKTTREMIDTNRSTRDGLYHMRHEVKVDGSTSASSVQRFLTASSYLVGSERVQAALEADPKLLERFWRSERVLDYVVKPEGMKKLFGASEADLHAAYAAAYEELDRPWDQPTLFGMENKAWRTTPWLNTTHPDYREVLDLLKAGPEAAPSQEGQQNTRDNAYQALTGRNLYQDHEAYQEANQSVALIQALGRAPNAERRTDLFVKAEDAMQLDPLRELGMLARIAGRDALAVKELRIRDRSEGKDLVFEAFGLTGDPREEIDRGLAIQ